jgi:hypothetical protein
VRTFLRIGAVLAFLLVAVGAWFSALAVTAVLFLLDRIEGDRSTTGRSNSTHRGGHA